MADFVHLHNHTHYSLLDGACKIDDMLETAKNFGMDALAITDHGNMFGAIEFYKKANKAKIKPIIGAEVYIAPASRFTKTSGKSGGSDTSFHLVLLAKNNQGYKNLMKLVSIGYLEGFYYKPRIDKEVLKQYSDGIIALTACLKGEVAQKIVRGQIDEAERAALEYREIFKDDFYLEIHRHNIPEEEIVLNAMTELSAKLSIPLVATNDIHYLKKEHAFAHDILLCLQTGKNIKDQNRMRYTTEEVYFKSPEQMKELFHDFPDAIQRTVEIANKCHLELDTKTIHLPSYTVPDEHQGSTLDEYLRYLTEEGVRDRYSEITPALQKRMDHELAVIQKMGYAGYFLIVKDFIDAARQRDIPVGPGRGSAAGSLVSYALRITNIDPIEYDLLFERFLNPERVSMPDIDIDFCYERREEVIQYVKEKYGDKNVTQIITFGTMAARGVIRDVGRVLEISLSDVDKIAKLIPATLGMTLDKALELVPELRDVAKQDDVHRQLIENSRILEGLARHSSIHAAGVVITPGELTNYMPLFKSSQGDVTTQFDMKSLDSVGVLKMDFLGLRTLTVMDDTLKLLRKRGVELDLDALNLEDPDTFKIFGNGETIGVFQFESSGMRDCLRRLQPQRIGDLIAMNALYRPGPMDMIDDFINRKHGRTSIEYLHPMLEPILRDTYGVMVYQEQVMRVASDLAGFSLGAADLLRRAMGKKEHALMTEQRLLFVQGAAKNGIDEKSADEIFTLMAKFAGYGFNKSHAAGYSLVAYQTAYLKAHYPAEFMAANMTSEMNNTSRIVILMEECRRMGIQILPPDVNESSIEFTVVGNSIRFGLGAVKNVGKNALTSILNAREKTGKFKTIFDLFQEIDTRLVNKKVLESLIQAGALDSLDGHRAQLVASLDLASGYCQSFAAHRANGQTSIFDAGDSNVALELPQLPKVEPWGKSEQLSREKELLGFYFSGHPLSKFDLEMQMFSKQTLAEIQSLPDKAQVKVGAIITQIKKHFDRKNRTMAFVTIEDLSGTSEMIIFADAYSKYQELLVEDTLVFVYGKTSSKGDNDDTKILCDELIPLDKVWDRCAKNIHLSLKSETTTSMFIQQIKGILSNSNGRCGIYFNIKTPENGEYVVKSKKLMARPSPALVHKISDLIGQENISIEC
ncbi:MAG: DNA polymerase III subunit alpha [Candidatus Zhuqueibacterota bacterium]